MSGSRNPSNLTRRHILRSLAASAASLAATRAFAQSDDPLQQLIQQNQRGGLGESFDSTSRTIAMPKSSLPTLSPATVQTTELAVARYEKIATEGGWPMVPVNDRLRTGVRNPAVPVLRQRLTLSGDLDPSAVENDVYDSYVDAAVKRFQARHGISADGRPGALTMKALNVPAEQRLSQLKTNLARLRALDTKGASRFVVCNIPAAQLEAIENGTVMSRHIAVAGKPDRPSPELNSRIVEINFNPFWTVPVSIVRKDLIPKMQAEPDYLTRYGIRIFDPKNNELTPAQVNWFSEEAVNYRFKQDPGEKNSLGTIRINFPSAHGVYMHDTPYKNLFGDDVRFDSSGCMRIQNVRDLVVWLLSETSGWSRIEIEDVIKSGARTDAKLKPQVPLHWVYITGWATADGVVQFRDDIYNRDGLNPPAAASRG
ncbi:MAG: L,D-transpeptidase YcbB [Hyphomicrobiales bacterium]|jgi:murein L,D-transpeptidase YcbB/YkuD|nr:L,D-transpeptidase YcbB [Hyphomicrobiales bacterium]